MAREKAEIVARFKGYEIENGREVVNLDLDDVDLDRTLDGILARFCQRNGRGDIRDYAIHVEPQHSPAFIHSSGR